MEKFFEKYSTPLSVLAGALIIGGALYWGGTGSKQAQPQQPDQAAVQKQLAAMNPITDQDHIRGNRNAKVFIVEYSDTECPFCQRFHATMKDVIEKAGPEGDVAWVYRHFPLDALHSKARGEAVALECANEQGGNDAFWKYADRLYETTPANNGLDPAELPKIAAYVGLDTTAFAACLTSGKYDARIEADVQNAVATGGNGTPWSIVVSASGKKFPLSGAQPVEAIEQLIELARKAK
tara:strand:- start:331560 stop:332270 length:711 start_codon:yes stop_codon:yes gene_type:complete